MTTNANVRSPDGGHWYYSDGRPCYEVAKKDGTGMTKTTLAHARRLGLMPSVTTILRILDKPALTAWKVEQAILSVMTTPRIADETDDDFVLRVLSTDKVQDEERDASAKLGTDIHAAIAGALDGKQIDESLAVYVLPVVEACGKFGKLVASEKIVCGDGYAGKFDALFDQDGVLTLVDFKTTRKLPKASYPEHRLQLAAYAVIERAQLTANIYISTSEPGIIKVCVNDKSADVVEAFNHLVKVWQWINNYKP
jgi:hypothetical protein